MLSNYHLAHTQQRLETIEAWAKSPKRGPRLGCGGKGNTNSSQRRRVLPFYRYIEYNVLMMGCGCQNVCSMLTAFRLELIEHSLSRYINNIDCVNCRSSGQGRRPDK